VSFWLAVRPSPPAVTVTVAVPAAAAEEAARVKVEAPVRVLDEGVSGLALQLAVTPAGRPVTERLMFPVNDPPVVAVKATATFDPGVTVAELDAAARVSVGGWLTVRA
jgi:hypothetical protein